MTDIKTSEITMEDLRPCDFCGGKIAPIFRILDIKHAVIGQGTRELIGYAAMGFPPGIADAFRSSPIAEVCEDGVTRLFVCNDCWSDGKFDEIQVVMEKVKR